MIDVVIKRSEWFRGNGPSFSALLLADGRKCCLGFASLAGSLSETDILGRTSPGQIQNVPVPPALAGLVCQHRVTSTLPSTLMENSQVALDLMQANDNREMSDARRESFIHEEGLKIGLNFTFEV